MQQRGCWSAAPARRENTLLYSTATDGTRAIPGGRMIRHPSASFILTRALRAAIGGLSCANATTLLSQAIDTQVRQGARDYLNRAKVFNWLENFMSCGKVVIRGCLTTGKAVGSKSISFQTRGSSHSHPWRWPRPRFLSLRGRCRRDPRAPQNPAVVA